MKLTLIERQARSTRAVPCPQPDNNETTESIWRNEPEVFAQHFLAPAGMIGAISQEELDGGCCHCEERAARRSNLRHADRRK
jgi:hypothetical protein